MVSRTKAPPTSAPSVEAEPSADDCESTTKEEVTVALTTRRPTLIDFIPKFKVKRDIQPAEAECGCGGKMSIADGIAEHVVDKRDETSVELGVDHEDELEESYSHNLKERSAARAKRSIDVDDDDSNNKKSQTSPFSCSSSAFCSAVLKKTMKTTATTTTTTSSCSGSSGTCDRIET